MAAVNAVEYTDGEEERSGQSLELRNRPQNFHCGSLAQAPRMRETCGSERIRCAICSRGCSLIWSTVIALPTSNRPDCVRRKDFKCAPQPSNWPISCA